jgi:hypothetical protein
MSDAVSAPLPTDMDTDLPPDPALFAAARADVDRLRRDYLLAIETLKKTTHRDEDFRAALGRLDRARSALSAALNILDFSRGDL